MPVSAKKPSKPIKAKKPKKLKVTIIYPVQGQPVPCNDFPAFGTCPPSLKKVYAVLYSKGHVNEWHGVPPNKPLVPGTWAVLFSSVGLAQDLTLEIYNHKGGTLLARRRGINVVAPGDLTDNLEKPFYPTDNSNIPLTVTAWGLADPPINPIDTSDDKTVMIGASGAVDAHGMIVNNPTATYNVYMVSFTVAGTDNNYRMKITDTGGNETDVYNLHAS